MIDSENTVTRLCGEGMNAEVAGRLDEARIDEDVHAQRGPPRHSAFSPRGYREFTRRGIEALRGRLGMANSA